MWEWWWGGEEFFGNRGGRRLAFGLGGGEGITIFGCGALCAAYCWGWYVCFGGAVSVDMTSLGSQWQSLGVGNDDLVRALRTFNGYAPEFREASEAYEH